MRKALLAILLVLLAAGGLTFARRDVEIKPTENLNKTEEPKKYKLAFVGDIMLSRNVGKKIEENGDSRYPFILIGDELTKYDFLAGNLENPMSERGVDQKHYYSFRAKPEVVEGLTYAGFDFISLANNHIWDWGRDALIDTKAILDEVKIGSAGAGENEEEANKPFTYKFGTTTVGFLSYTPLFGKDVIAGKNAGTSNFFKAKEQIIELKKSVNLVVVMVHWGDEYKKDFNPREQKVAHEWIDAGADLIIGSHPHVVQGTEEYKGRYIVYSLGNFVFDQNFSAETMKGLLVEIELRNGSFTDLNKREIKINENFQPSFAL